MNNILLTLSLLVNMSCALVEKEAKVKTFGVNHVGLSVKDLKATSDFFIKALKFKKVDEKPEYPAIFVSDGKILVTLWQVKNPKKSVSFDRKNNVGLHHLAFSVNSFNALDTMYKRLKDWPGIKIQFSPELLGKGPTKHMMFYGPSGIRFELIHKP